MQKCDKDQYAQNWEQQVEEVQVLESIFEDDFKFIGLEEEGVNEGDTITLESIGECPPPAKPSCLEFQILVSVTLPFDKISLQFKPSIDPGSEQDKSPTQDTKEEDTGQIIQYLPKIDLWVSLGPRYPSSESPNFEISAMWLSQQQIKRCEDKFREMWEEKDEPEPVVFEWLDWLGESCLEYLNCDKILCIDGSKGYGGSAGEEEDNAPLSANGEFSSGGFDAVGGQYQFNDPAEQVFVQLLRFNRIMEQEHFDRTLHTCQVCYEEKLGNQFVRIRECGHEYCDECLRTHCQVHVKEGSLDQLKCFQPECKKPLSQQVLHKVLDDEEYQRWETLTLQQALDSMADVVYCPRCESIALQEEEKLAQCPKCWFAFCPLCGQSYHPGSECMSKEQQLAILKERQKGSQAGNIKADEIRRKIQSLQNEVLSKTYIQAHGGKDCPTCKFAIIKDGGCNKVTCSKCGSFMCWKCGQKIKGYDHFQGGCILFDEAGLLEFQAQRAYDAQAGRVRRQVANQVVNEFADANGVRPRRINCPNCRQENFKLDNNNHMRCWACQGHFCYVCRQALPRRGGGRHFTPPGCRQHSND